MKELIERLRDLNEVLRVWDRISCEEAADALEQQAKRIAELERATDHAIEINNNLQSELEQQAKQIEELENQRRNWLDTDLTAKALVEQEKEIEELAAALAGKDEALRSVPRSRTNAESCEPDIIDRALALRPSAALVAKIKAEGVRDYAKYLMEKGRFNESYLVDDFADRIERGEMK